MSKKKTNTEKYKEFHKKLSKVNKIELWSLDYTIGVFLYHRIKAYRQLAIVRWGGITEDKHYYERYSKLLKDLEKMEEGFGIIANEETYFNDRPEDVKKVDKALKLLKKNFRQLWY